jgi:hypothetical protein
MKAAFDRALKGLSGLAAVEDQGNVSFDRPIPEQLMSLPGVLMLIYFNDCFSRILSLSLSRSIESR